jgi:hypothetical protein
MLKSPAVLEFPSPVAKIAKKFRAEKLFMPDNKYFVRITFVFN